MDALEICNKLRSEASGVATSGIPLDVFPQKMQQMIINLQSQNKPHKANTHIPMSVEEASAYLKMPMATLYMKLGNGSIPAIKPGKRYCLYQDELDKWLETNRKNPVPLTAEEENAAILAGNKRKPKLLNW